MPPRENEDVMAAVINIDQWTSSHVVNLLVKIASATDSEQYDRCGKKYAQTGPRSSDSVSNSRMSRVRWVQVKRGKVNAYEMDIGTSKLTCYKYFLLGMRLFEIGHRQREMGILKGFAW